MLNENAKKWVAALRSGEYKQCKNRLAHAGRFCCLGVACDISPTPRKIWGQQGTLPTSVMCWLNIRHAQGAWPDEHGVNNHSLAGLNDWDGKTFEEIADVIESEPEGLFCDQS